ncbi:MULTISPECIES: dihydrofolate reductase [Micrococcaceae]|uniref:dihydrofolate reductase n=1 Tax=unclassified Kocuria TaxID=2649579 RepID=UPI001012953E|nr:MULTISPECIES: dihydrofolate reductase [unclassified Kocuria]
MSESVPNDSMPRLSAIWAQARGRIIGRQGSMPWSVPSDLAFFKRATSGGPVVMGRTTWESFPARFRPLPERTNIVLTRTLPSPADPVTGLAYHDGALWTSDLAKALETARRAPRSGEDLWVIGGSHLYEQILQLRAVPGVLDGRVTRVLVTELDIDVAGDRKAPELGAEWHVEEATGGIDERGKVAGPSGTLQPRPVPFRFLEYRR